MQENDLNLAEALGGLQQAIDADRKSRVLTQKQARSTDRLLLKELKASRRTANRKPAGFAKRVGKRALGGVGGAISGALGNAIGSIPIAGTIFRVLGQEFKNARFDKKQYQKVLKQRRKVELKEMDRMAKAKAKLDAKAEEKQERQDAPKSERGGSSKAIEKLADAALHLEATAISMTPAIQTFHETAEKMAEVVDRMEENSRNPQKVTDDKALEYLHAIDFLTQASAATAERNEEKLATMVKDIGNIKWHMARANGSAGRIEKIMQSNQGGSKFEVKTDAQMLEDTGKIKWHIARISGSTSRIEKLLQTAAEDRVKMLDNQKEDLKLQEKQVDLQDSGNSIGLLGAVTNLFGGVGTVALLGPLAATLGPILAGAVGVAIGDAINKLIPTTDIGQQINEAFGRGVDRILAFFGDDEAKARLGMKLQNDNLESANRADESLNQKENNPEEYATHQQQWQQDFAKDKGYYDFKQRHIVKNPDSWWGHNFTEPMYQHEADALEQQNLSQAAQMQDRSSEISDAKSAPQATDTGGNFNMNAASNVTNNTITQQPITTQNPRDAGNDPTKRY